MAKRVLFPAVKPPKVVIVPRSATEARPAWGHILGADGRITLVGDRPTGGGGASSGGPASGGTGMSARMGPDGRVIVSGQPIPPSQGIQIHGLVTVQVGTSGVDTVQMSTEPGRLNVDDAEVTVFGISNTVRDVLTDISRLLLVRGQSIMELEVSFTRLRSIMQDIDNAQSVLIRRVDELEKHSLGGRLFAVRFWLRNKVSVPIRRWLFTKICPKWWSCGKCSYPNVPKRLSCQRCGSTTASACGPQA